MSKLLVDEISDADNTGPVTVTDGLNVSSGNVGIGTSSPSGAKLEIFTASNSTDGLKISRYTPGNYYSTLRQDNHGLAIHVGTGGTVSERVAITPNGITFNGDTAAANALDDYEEGTWTVVNRSIASLTISNSAQARYVKIGGLVFIHFYITYPSTADTNQAKISLPFVCTGYGMLTGRLQNSAKSGTTGFVMQTLDSTDESVFYPITSASNAYINSELNGSFLLLSGCYQTSA
jgi:hypothetical protein